MTRSELVERLSDQYPSLTRADVAAAVSVILEAITDTLVLGDRVEIRDFGTFRINCRPPRIGRNPKTGARVDVAAKVVPHFKPGLGLRERVQEKMESN
ncbi:MAG: integration host factor subunit beta [Georgfuchsia sp.]